MALFTKPIDNVSVIVNNHDVTIDATLNGVQFTEINLPGLTLEFSRDRCTFFDTMSEDPFYARQIINSWKMHAVYSPDPNDSDLVNAASKANHKMRSIAARDNLVGAIPILNHRFIYGKGSLYPGILMAGRVVMGKDDVIVKIVHGNWVQTVKHSGEVYTSRDGIIAAPMIRLNIKWLRRALFRGECNKGIIIV